MAKSADQKDDAEDNTVGNGSNIKRPVRSKRSGAKRPQKNGSSRATAGKRRRAEATEHNDDEGKDGGTAETPAAKQPRTSLYGRTIGLFGRAVGGAVGLLTPGRGHRQSTSNSSPGSEVERDEEGGATSVVQTENLDFERAESGAARPEDNALPEPQQHRRQRKARGDARDGDGEGGDKRELGDSAVPDDAAAAAGEDTQEARGIEQSDYSRGFRNSPGSGVGVEKLLEFASGTDNFRDDVDPRSRFGEGSGLEIRRVPALADHRQPAFRGVDERFAVDDPGSRSTRRTVGGVAADDRRRAHEPFVFGNRPEGTYTGNSRSALQSSRVGADSIQQRRAVGAAAALGGGAGSIRVGDEEEAGGESKVDEYAEPFTAKETRDLLRAMRYRRDLPPVAALYLLTKLESPSAAHVRLQIIRENKEFLRLQAATGEHADEGAVGSRDDMLSTVPSGHRAGFGDAETDARGYGADAAMRMGAPEATRSAASGAGSRVPLVAPVARRRFAPPGAEAVPTAPLHNEPLMLPPPPRGFSKASGASSGIAARDTRGMTRPGSQYDRQSSPLLRGGDPDGLLTPARRSRALERQQDGGRGRSFAASTPGGDRVWKVASSANQGTPWAGSSRTRAYGGDSVARVKILEGESPRRPRHGADGLASSDRYGEPPRTPAAMARRIIRVLDDASSPRSPPSMPLPASTPPRDVLALRRERPPAEDGPLPTKTLSVPHPKRRVGGASGGVAGRRSNKTASAAKLPPSKWARREIQTQTEGGRLREEDFSPTPAKRQSHKRKTDEYEGEGGEEADIGGRKASKEGQTKASRNQASGDSGHIAEGNDEDEKEMVSPHRNKRARTNSEVLRDQQQQQQSSDQADKASTTSSTITASSKAAQGNGATKAGDGKRDTATDVLGSAAGSGKEKNNDNDNGRSSGGAAAAAPLVAEATASATPGVESPAEGAARNMEARRRNRHLSGRSPYVRGGGRVDPNSGLPTSMRPPLASPASKRVGFPFADAKKTPSQDSWTCRGCYVQNYDMRAKECDMCRRARNFGTPQFKNPRARLPGGTTFYNNLLILEAAKLVPPRGSPPSTDSSGSATTVSGAGAASATPAAPSSETTVSSSATAAATPTPATNGSTPPPTFKYGSVTSAKIAAPAAAGLSSSAGPAFSFGSGGTPSATPPAAAAPAPATPAFQFGAGAPAPATATTGSTSAATSADAGAAPGTSATSAATTGSAKAAAPKSAPFQFGVAASGPAPTVASGSSTAVASDSARTPAVAAAAPAPSDAAVAPAPAPTPSFTFGSTAPKPPAPSAATPSSAPGASAVPSFTFGAKASAGAAAATPAATPSPVAAFTFGGGADASKSAPAAASSTPTASFTFGGAPAPAAATNPAAAGAAPAASTPAPAAIFGTAAPGSASAGAPSPVAPAFSFGTAPAPSAGRLGPAPGAATAGGLGLAAPTPSAFGGFGGGGFGATAGGASGTKRASSPAVGAGGFGIGTQGAPKRGASPGAAAFGGFGGGAPSPAPPSSASAFGTQQLAAPGSSVFGAAAAAPSTLPTSGAAFSFGAASPAAPVAGGFGAQSQQVPFGVAPPAAGGGAPTGFGVVGGGFGGVPGAASAAPATGGFNLGAGGSQQGAQTRGTRRIVKARRQNTTRRR